MVAVRKVYLSQGFAYLPATELQSFVLNKYKIHLKEQLAVSFFCLKLMFGLESCLLFVIVADEVRIQNTD